MIACHRAILNIIEICLFLLLICSIAYIQTAANYFSSYPSNELTYSILIYDYLISITTTFIIEWRYYDNFIKALHLLWLCL